MSRIATIFKSQSHQLYTAQVINPLPEDIEFNNITLGNFVSINNTVGLVCDTEIYNPNGLINSQQKEDIYLHAPDLKEEIDIYLKILIIGYKNTSNTYIQEMPSNIIEAWSDVYLLTPEEIKEFHLNNNKLQVKYLVQLASQFPELNMSLVKIIKNKLNNLLEKEQLDILHVIERNLLWQTQG